MMSSPDHQEVLKKLRSLAGNRSYDRGEEYFEEGLVGRITAKDGAISAKVHGTHSYQVRLSIVRINGKLSVTHACSCPMGRDGDFCKHCVAVGLAWLEQRQETAEPDGAKSAGARNKSVNTKDIRKWLEALDPKVALDMLMAQVAADDRLRQEIVIRIAKENARGIDLSAYRTAIRTACHVGGYMDYGDTYDYSEGISEVADGIEQLLKEGLADETILLCEYALEQLGAANERIDDSDGYVGEQIERLLELHLKACKKGNPEPDALAERLFRYEVAWGGYDIFYGAVNTYKDVLGKQGVAEYRRLVEKEWRAVPAKGPGSRDSGWDSKRERITRIMESLAKAEGDIDGLIAIKKRDLSSPWKFLEIAEVLRKGERHDEALKWAEDGLKAFGDRPDNRLRNFLAEEYHRRKRYDEAYALYRVQFAERPGLELYKKLLEYAKRIKREDQARQEALALVRKEADKEKNNPKARYWHHKPDHSLLVEIFLWEKDLEAAWSEAQAGGCRDTLWLELARAREKDHPVDAVEVYRRLVEPVIERKKNDAYEEAVRMIGKIRELMAGMGKKAAFAAYLAEVRLRHKPKRNLMKLLESF